MGCVCSPTSTSIVYDDASDVIVDDTSHVQNVDQRRHHVPLRTCTLTSKMSPWLTQIAIFVSVRHFTVDMMTSRPFSGYRGTEAR